MNFVHTSFLDQIGGMMDISGDSRVFGTAKSQSNSYIVHIASCLPSQYVARNSVRFIQASVGRVLVLVGVEGHRPLDQFRQGEVDAFFLCFGHAGAEGALLGQLLALAIVGERARCFRGGGGVHSKAARQQRRPDNCRMWNVCCSNWTSTALLPYGSTL
jgi:hypothetical protein